MSVTIYLFQLNPQPNPPPQNSQGNMNIISTYISLQATSQTGSSSLVFDPRGAGFLYTFQSQSVQYWLDNEMDNSWRQVAAGELLQPGPGSAIPKPNLWSPTHLETKRRHSRCISQEKNTMTFWQHLTWYRGVWVILECKPSFNVLLVSLHRWQGWQASSSDFRTSER